MTLFYLTKEGDRPKVAQPSPLRMVPDPYWEPPGEGEEPTEPEIILDPRPDEVRVLDGYPGYAVAGALPRPLEDYEDYVDGEIVGIPALAEAKALALLDRKQDAAELGAVALTRRVLMFSAWYELQDMKTLTSQQIGAMTGAQKGARWPLVMSLVAETGNGLSGVATSLEADLKPIIEKLARFAARAELARREVKAAASAEGKIAAAEGAVIEDQAAARAAGIVGVIAHDP